MKYSELNEFYNVFNDDETLAEYVFEDVLPHVLSDVFKEQSKVVYMAGEQGKYPEMKPEAIETIKELVERRLGFVVSYITHITADMIYRGIVNPGEDTAWYLKEFFGHEYPNWEDVYPNGVPFEEYCMCGDISSRPAYSWFESDPEE